MTVKDKKILTFLCGYTDPADQGKVVEPPSPGEVKSFLRRLPHQAHRRIAQGQYGRIFAENSNEMLRRFAEAERAEKAKQKK